MKIYLDVVLLENFIMNYIIIVSTAIISKSRLHFGRIALASLLAGIYSIFNYLLEFSTIKNMIFKILISSIIVLMSFDSRKLKSTIKQLILFYLVSFTFGGISFMLLFLVNPENVKFQNGILIGTYPIKITLIGGGVRIFDYCVCGVCDTRQNENEVNAM